MVTVEADPVRVESRLAAGGIGCPTCGVGVLGGWGYARVRQVEGLSDLLRPRRAPLPGLPFAATTFAAALPWLAGRLGTPDVSRVPLPGLAPSPTR